MKLDWLSQELREIIEMALITHEEFCGEGRFWDCPKCAPERAGIIKSIDMEARIAAVRMPV